MGIGSSILRVLTWWNGQTLNTQLFTWRKGVRVGEDELGNVYYENREKSKRWVIFNGEIEASKVSPDWHGWLHHTWDEPPTKKLAADLGIEQYFAETLPENKALLIEQLQKEGKSVCFVGDGINDSPVLA